MACLDTCGSIGSYTKVAREDSVLTGECPPATFDASSLRIEILQENIQYTDVTLGGGGLTGVLDKTFSHLRNGTRMVYGRLLFEVGPNELAWWLPKIFGNAPTGAPPTTYTTATTHDLKPFDIMMSRDQGTVIYRHCAVNRALIRGRASIEGQEQVLQLAVDIIGYEEHDSTWPTGGSEPPLITATRLFWLVGDGKLTLAATEYYFEAFNLLVDNNLLPQTRNFLRVTCLQSRGRQYRLQVSMPYTTDSHDDLYIDRFTGAAVLNFLGTKNLTGVDGENMVSTITMPNVYQTRRTPSVQGPGEIPLSVDLEGYRVGTTAPITATIVTTL